MIHEAGMSMYDMAMAALTDDDGWMFAYCCDHMSGDELERARRANASKIEADLMDCLF